MPWDRFDETFLNKISINSIFLAEVWTKTRWDWVKQPMTQINFRVNLLTLFES
jgi:hypothetical protein